MSDQLRSIEAENDRLARELRHMENRNNEVLALRSMMQDHNGKFMFSRELKKAPLFSDMIFIVLLQIVLPHSFQINIKGS